MVAHVIDVHEELEDAKVSAFHWRLGAIMGLLTLFDGYDTFNPAYVIIMSRTVGSQGGQSGLLISSGLVGFLLAPPCTAWRRTGSDVAARSWPDSGSPASSRCSPRYLQTHS